MKIEKKIVFVRHPESIGNTMSQDERAALEVPNHSYPLTPAGREQMKLTARYLKREFHIHWFDTFFQSTFLRTQEGMAIVLGEFGLDVEAVNLVTDSRLDEKWDGIFHELPKRDIEERYPEQIRTKKRAGYYHYRAPGGESCPDVEMRIRSLVDEYLAEPFYGKTGYHLIVGHGRWFQIFQKLVHNLSVAEYLELKSRDQDNCSVTFYTPQNCWQGLENIPASITPWKGSIQTESSQYA